MRSRSATRIVNAFGPEPPDVPGARRPKDWQKIGLAEVDTSGIEWLPTDDWPFLYLRDRRSRRSTSAGCSGGRAFARALVRVRPATVVRPNGQMFFLGAGFMLLETKGVVQMALLFGSTWVVNSIVFAAILVMILLSNLFVLLFRPGRRWTLYYTLLIAALLINYLVPMNSYLGLSGVARAVLSCCWCSPPCFSRESSSPWPSATASGPTSIWGRTSPGSSWGD